MTLNTHRQLHPICVTSVREFQVHSRTTASHFRVTASLDMNEFQYNVLLVSVSSKFILALRPAILELQPVSAHE